MQRTRQSAMSERRDQLSSLGPRRRPTLYDGRELDEEDDEDATHPMHSSRPYSRRREATPDEEDEEDEEDDCDEGSDQVAPDAYREVVLSRTKPRRAVSDDQTYSIRLTRDDENRRQLDVERRSTGRAPKHTSVLLSGNSVRSVQGNASRADNLRAEASQILSLFRSVHSSFETRALTTLRAESLQTLQLFTDWIASNASDSSIWSTNSENLEARVLITNNLTVIQERLREIESICLNTNIRRDSTASDTVRDAIRVISEQTQWLQRISGKLNPNPRHAPTSTLFGVSQRSSVSILSEPTAAAIIAQLPPDVRMFIDIPANDHHSCETFIRRKPAVLDEDTSRLQDAARVSIQHGFIDQAQRIVDRCIIIHASRKMGDGTTSYLRSLRGHPRQSDQHRDSCDRLIQALTGQIAVSPDRSVSNSGRNSMSDPSEKVPPPDPLVSRFTDLRSGALQTRSAPSSRNASELAKEYSVRKDAGSFFVRGRVFKVLWHQPAGYDSHGLTSAQNTKAGMFGEPVYSTVRHMLVIKPKHSYSICCPITSYGQRGLTMKTLPDAEIRAHSIVYSSTETPKALRGEPHLSKGPVPVILEQGQESLNSASRIHFGKSYTVEWNVKVMNIGMVPEQHLARIRAYFVAELN